MCCCNNICKKTVILSIINLNLISILILIFIFIIYINNLVQDEKNILVATAVSRR